MVVNKKSLGVFGKLAVIGALLFATGCSSSAANVLNPFDSSSTEPELGERNLNPVLGAGSGNGGRSEDEVARHALEVVGSYQRGLAPQPYNPVMNPAQVRLMWIPDHINKAGDLVPAHFYYLRVLPQTWAVQDGFEIEQQLNVKTGPEAGGAQPWVYSDTKK